MLGAIIGDIVGSRWEFNSTNDYNFEFFSAKNSYTDDTICTIGVADALLRHEDFGKVIHEWCRRYGRPMGGYGGRFRQWVDSDNPRPYRSFGNGSAMRVSPVAWVGLEEEDLLVAAKESAMCTHNHPEGVKGAQAVALAIHDCRGLRDKYGHMGEKEIREGLERALQLSGYDIDIRLKDVQNNFDETCQGTVPVAFWIITRSTDFEDAIRKAVSLGADADTLGAIVGGIAEAIWGIPEWMKERAISYLPDDMRAVLNKIHRGEGCRHRRDSESGGAQGSVAAKAFTPENITELKADQVFVFGSNLLGHHGGGAARTANRKFGAKWGVGVGPTGQSYAIPTMQGGVETIKPYVDQFIEYAKANPGKQFLVTPIGCGIAGFSPKDIAPLFREAVALENVCLPMSFCDVIGGGEK